MSNSTYGAVGFSYDKPSQAEDKQERSDKKSEEEAPKKNEEDTEPFKCLFELPEGMIAVRFLFLFLFVAKLCFLFKTNSQRPRRCI